MDEHVPDYNYIMISMIANEEGTSNLEYALVASLIAFVAIIAVSYVGQSSKSSFNNSGRVMKNSLNPDTMLVGGGPGNPS